jgi:endogenous inhibitor of DNA gyrase (YacG/DUF329 family)
MAADFDFIKSVLGDQAAEVLFQAVQKSESLAPVLVPRTILAWLNTVSSYEGPIPGTNNTYVKLVKSELGGFSGSVTIGEDLYPMEAASVFEAVAAVATALEVKIQPEAKIRNLELEKLGKSIDLMAKTQLLKTAVGANKPCPNCGTSVAWKNDRAVFHLHEGKMCKGVKKGENFGPPHAPEKLRPEPAVAVSPEAPAPSKPKRPKPPTLGKPKVIHLDKSETTVPCPVCSQTQFKEEEFVGCICLKYLAKSAEVVTFGKRVTIQLDPEEWDSDAILTLFDSVGRND